MSRDVLTVGSTMRIPLLYRGEYSQWVERIMNYLEEETDEEAMINSIKNGDQPLPHVTQVSIAGTTSTEQPPLKDKSMVEKKDDEKKRDMSRVKCYNCKKEGYFAKDCKKAKVKDYEYYKTKMLLAKKDKDEQVLLAEDQEWMESSSDSDQEINENMVFMAQIEKVLSDSEASSSSVDEKISEVSYYLSESESESEFETSEYYDNSDERGFLIDGTGRNPSTTVRELRKGRSVCLISLMTICDLNNKKVDVGTRVSTDVSSVDGVQIDEIRGTMEIEETGKEDEIVRVNESRDRPLMDENYGVNYKDQMENNKVECKKHMYDEADKQNTSSCSKSASHSESTIRDENLGKEVNEAGEGIFDKRGQKKNTKDVQFSSYVNDALAKNSDVNRILFERPS
nr:hypothetical protein [Tanacetum cinerariifolium]